MLKIGIIQPDNKYRSVIKRYCLLHDDILCLFAEDTINDAINQSVNLDSWPDVLLIEIIPGNILTGELINKINKQFHNPAIVILGFIISGTNLLEYLELGVKGYILKKENPVDVINKIKSIESGGLPFSPEVLRGVINDFQKTNNN